MKTPKLGQHFLTDDSVIEKIASSAQLSQKDTVLEVGPGKGILTAALVNKAGKVVAVEKDGELHHKLKKRFKDYPNLELVLGDIREFNLSILPANYKVAANIPYYLTGLLIRSLFSANNPPSLAVLMIQKEVAERLTAPKGESSLLQLTTFVTATVQKVLDVPKESFDPVPQVDSAVVVFSKRSKPLVQKAEQRAFFRILKFAFAGKRKKVTNTLSHTLNLPRKKIIAGLKHCGHGEAARPQELNIEDWVCFYEGLKKSLP